MPRSTSTIRVPTRTRDELARQAHAQGVSLATLVTEIAEQNRRDALYAAERAAVERDRQTTNLTDERVAWEDTLSDGFD